MTGCLVGSDEAGFRRRAQRLHERSGTQDGAEPQAFDQWLAGLTDTWVVGTAEQAVDRLGQLTEAGVEAVMLQLQLPRDLDMLDEVAENVAPRL